jgi:hypothetical protein
VLLADEIIGLAAGFPILFHRARGQQVPVIVFAD